MEHKMVTIPFDLETAKRIREGKISGRIVTEKGRRGAARRLGKMCLMWSTNASSMWS